jgi:hypothetical protein
VPTVELLSGEEEDAVDVAVLLRGDDGVAGEPSTPSLDG